MDGAAEPIEIDAEAEANKRAAEAAAELERPVKKAKTEDAAAVAQPVVEQQHGAADVSGAAPPEAAADQQTAEHTAAPAAGEAAAQHEALPTTPSKASAAADAQLKGTPSPGPQHKARLGDVVYRVLVPARAVSIVIGKGGCNVRELQSHSGARIQVGVWTVRILTVCCIQVYGLVASISAASLMFRWWPNCCDNKYHTEGVHARQSC